MTTSSGEPARLTGYPNNLIEPDDQLTSLAGELDVALQAFSAGAGAYLPAGFDPAAAGGLVRGLRDESQHLANWVAGVGYAFMEADADVDGDGIYLADDAFLAGRVGAASIAEAMVIPRPGTDPAAVARWWASTPPGVRERLIRERFAELGMLRGLPAVDIDRVNRLRLDYDLRDLSGRLAAVDAAIVGLPGPMEGEDQAVYENRYPEFAERARLLNELANAQKIDQQMRDLDGRFAGYPPGPRPYLLTYAYQNEGRFAVALGNPDLATHTGIVVPGTSHDVQHEGGLFGPVGDAQRLYGQMNIADLSNPGENKNAVILWMGTDMPDQIPNATNPTYGDTGHGAGWLRDDVAGYQTAHAQATGGDDGHTTVVAHSYGSYLTGEAVKSGMRVDDFVSIGSAGINTGTSSQLGLDPGHVWAGATSNDIVPQLEWHGQSPTKDTFGANVFATSDSNKHSEYYKENSQSLGNMGLIATGRYDDVVRRSPDSSGDANTMGP